MFLRLKTGQLLLTILSVVMEGEADGISLSDKIVFKNYVQFNGRSRRSEYWWPWLLNIIVVVPTLGVGAIMLEDSGGAGANVLAVMLIFLGTLYVSPSLFRPSRSAFADCMTSI